MLTVEDYGKIRRAHRDGMSVRAIARTFHHSRRKIRQVLIEPQTLHARIRASRAQTRPFQAAHIDETLAADKDAPHKQKHTAAQIFRRLRDEEGYTGCYDQVRRYVAIKRKRSREDLHPLVLCGWNRQAPAAAIHKFLCRM